MQDTANHKKWRQGYGDDRVTMEHTLLCDVCCEGRRLEHPGGGEVSDSLKASNEARCQTFNPRSPSGTGTLPNQKTTRLRRRMYTVIVRMVSCSICACPAVGHILVLRVNILLLLPEGVLQTIITIGSFGLHMPHSNS